MRAVADQKVVHVTLSLDEAVTLHEVLARAEFAEDLEHVDVHDEAEQEVLSRLQQSLAPLIPEFRTADADYGQRVLNAWNAIRGTTNT